MVTLQNMWLASCTRIVQNDGTCYTSIWYFSYIIFWPPIWIPAINGNILLIPTFHEYLYMKL